MEDIYQSESPSSTETNSRMMHKCKYCVRELSSRQNLREHLYIHTGEKPYICTEPGCGQKFRQGSLLSIHKKIHSEVRRSKKLNVCTDRRCVFPKLTDLLVAHDIFNKNQENLEISQMKSEIGEEEFSFIRAFIKK